MKTTIVTTTIYIPELLRVYAQNAKEFGHRDVDFVVIGDRKTPKETADFCKQLGREYYPCEYLDIDAQREYLEPRFPELWAHLRFDSIQRRNVGILRAWENGADTIITIDDDNWIMNQDFVSLHGRVGQTVEMPVTTSTSGWYNVCGELENSQGQEFYHRGYPQEMRWKENEAFVTHTSKRVKVAVNAGFWLDDPDIDALTRMHRGIQVRGWKPNAVGLPAGSFALEPGTWSPFNSQNTALKRDVVPAYFLSPYIGRYDDIWASYVVDRIAEHLGEVVAFGAPWVRQKRNPHDYWKDLDNERVGMRQTHGLCTALRGIRLTGADYHECLGQIVRALPQAWPQGDKWSGLEMEGRKQLLSGLAIWHGVFETIRATNTAKLLARVAQESPAFAGAETGTLSAKP
jgi:hypothetical protein